MRYLALRHPPGLACASLCVHLLATGLVFFLLRRHFLSPRIAATGALIFGVHPVHIEPVVWVSGVAEPLAAVWMLGSVLLWLRGRDTGNLKWEIGSLACYVAALLTMETAIILPVIVYAYAISGIETRRRTERTEGGQVKRALVRTLPFIVVTLVYVVVRLVITRNVPAPTGAASHAQCASLTEPSLILFYLQHLLP